MEALNTIPLKIFLNLNKIFEITVPANTYRTLDSFKCELQALVPQLRESDFQIVWKGTSGKENEILHVDNLDEALRSGNGTKTFYIYAKTKEEGNVKKGLLDLLTTLMNVLDTFSNSQLDIFLPVLNDLIKTLSNASGESLDLALEDLVQIVDEFNERKRNRLMADEENFLDFRMYEASAQLRQMGFSNDDQVNYFSNLYKGNVAAVVNILRTL
ncbi:hypothetical protein RI129_012485 [Pyrocoelia pectoralis]|uniref:Uncharacterized protein n=1 Tax=Pyrocoelia pectoralis TaxID=417401 RepID=A0AAN7UTF9_9COLE